MKQKLTLLFILLFAMVMHLQAMQINVTNPTTGIFTIDVESGDDILNVKAKIFDIQNIAVPMMTLKFGSTVLADANTLSYYNIGSGATLELILPSGTGISSDPYQITSLDNLYWLSKTQSVWASGTFFIQTANIDASASSGWDAGVGFSPIGTGATAFSGTYDGQNFIIDQLYHNFNLIIDVNELEPSGLFGFVSGAHLKNLHLANVHIKGRVFTGGMAGKAESTDFSNCHVTGAVNAMSMSGGFIGLSWNNTFTTCSANVSTTGTDLFGVPADMTHLGGFAGTVQTSSSFTNCYARGAVSGYQVGGFIGGIDLNSAAYGNPALIDATSGFTLTNCYAANQLTGSGPSPAKDDGGLYGQNLDAYNFDGLSVNNSYWDKDLAGTDEGYRGGDRKTTAEMKTEATFFYHGWNFNTIWSIMPSANNGYPELQGQSVKLEMTWTGSENDDWNTAANWTSNTIPTITDNVTIPDVTNGPIVHQNLNYIARCNNMTIAAGATLTIAPGKALTVKGNLTNNAGVSGLVIQSTYEGTGSLLHYTANVPAIIYRQIWGNSDLTLNTYHLVSIPLTPATASTQNLFFGAYLYEFNESTNLWKGLGNSTSNVMDETRGYMIYSPEHDLTYRFEGAMNAGTFSPMVTHTGAGNNLVPNPYPSAIDWNATTGWTKTNIANSVYIWPSAGSNYATYVDGTANNGGSSIIPAGQAFIVKASGVPTFSMTDDVRIHDSHSLFKSNETLADLLRIKATSNEMTDETVIRFKDIATSNADSEYDAWKLYGSDGAPQLYTLAADNEMLSINSLPFESSAYTVPLNFEQKATADVSFTFSNTESFDPAINIYLQDLKSGTTVNLRAQNTYTFSHTESNDAKRFKIIFGGTIGIGESPAETNRIWIIGNMLYINTPDFIGKTALVNFYTMTGQIVMQKNIALTGLSTISLESLKSGAVIAKLAVNGSIFTTKGILIQK